MNATLKEEIHQLIDSLNNEDILKSVKDDIAFYAGESDIIDDLSPEQLKELDNTLAETATENQKTWEDFRSGLQQWKEES